VVPVLPLSSQLANASADAQAAVQALANRARVDFGPLPRGALALLLARAAREHGRRFMVVVPDAVSGTRLEADLRFFCGDTDLEGLGTVLHYPSADTTPFVDVAPDFDTHRRQLVAAVSGDYDPRAIRVFIEQFLRPRGIDRPATPFMVEAIEEFAQSIHREHGSEVTETHS